MNSPRILVAGIGNIFLGDDAFGVEVVKRLSHRELPGCVSVVDYGIRGLDLAYALLDNYDVAILVDATGQGGDPGTLYVLEPELNDVDADRPQSVSMDAHAMDPMRVLDMVRAMGGRPRQVLVVGCEPATFGGEFEGTMGLSAPVESAVGGAIAIVESLIAKVAQPVDGSTSEFQTATS
ncbi:MAG TPA: hydrogenase maturation protease [Bryobacteraceae bacterium]|jgi:hydrogenase maturation protease|nr:hydrogenase maturation protease [Bryobacteraceae bacterium]